MPDYFVDALELQIKQTSHRIKSLAETIFIYPNYFYILYEIEIKHRYTHIDTNETWNFLNNPSRLNLGWACWFLAESEFAFDEKKYLWAMQCINDATLHIGQAQAYWENENARSKNSTKAADAKNKPHREAKQKVINFYNENIGEGKLFTGYRDKDYAAEYIADKKIVYYMKNKKIVNYPVETIRDFLKTPFDDYWLNKIVNYLKIN